MRSVLAASILLFFASSASATTLPAFIVDAVAGVPAGGEVQFGAPQEDDVSVVFQLDVREDSFFSVGVFFTLPGPTITGGGTIPGPDLDVQLDDTGLLVETSIEGEGLSDLFFVSFAEVGDRVGVHSGGSNIALVSSFLVPAPGTVPEPGAAILLLATTLLATRLRTWPQRTLHRRCAARTDFVLQEIPGFEPGAENPFPRP